MQLFLVLNMFLLVITATVETNLLLQLEEGGGAPSNKQRTKREKQCAGHSNDTKRH